MYLPKDRLVADVPLHTLRPLLRSGILRKSDLDMTGTADASKVLIALESEGLIELQHEFNQWKPTQEGRRVALASMRLYKREKVDHVLAELIARVEDINRGDVYAFLVTDLRIFGSYLGDSPMLSDLDVAYALKWRFEDKTKQDEREKVRRELHGYFPNWIDELLWPNTEVHRRLKNRSHVISLHPVNEVEQLGIPFKQIFPSGV